MSSAPKGFLPKLPQQMEIVNREVKHMVLLIGDSHFDSSLFYSAKKKLMENLEVHDVQVVKAREKGILCTVICLFSQRQTELKKVVPEGCRCAACQSGSKNAITLRRWHHGLWNLMYMSSYLTKQIRKKTHTAKLLANMSRVFLVG